MPQIAGVLSNTERHEQMKAALDLGFPFIEKAAAVKDGTVSIVCYGPSLLDTWPALFGLQDNPVITVSGAHDFVRRKGLIPTYHVEMDPRPHKAEMLTNPSRRTQYLMATVCHPNWWDKLEQYDVRLWHLINDSDTVRWIKEHHPQGMASAIGGGSTVGQRAMNVAAWMGYRKFNIFGMDCSYTDQRHAGPHTGDPQPEITVEANGRKFVTTPQLWQSAREMCDFLATIDAECTFYGDGMLQEMANTIRRKR